MKHTIRRSIHCESRVQHYARIYLCNRTSISFVVALPELVSHTTGYTRNFVETLILMSAVSYVCKS